MVGNWESIDMCPGARETSLNRKDSSRQKAILVATSIIREKSKEGRFVLTEEVLSELLNRGVLESEKEGDRFAEASSILEETLNRNEDLRERKGKDGLSRYYSSLTMSEAYATLLTRKEEDLLLMMAEVIRENSAIYPRPVPLDIFIEPPFDLTQEEILECLGKMGQQAEYQDIAQTTTSVGTVFLYSNRHLDPDHASMLAEWLDVGQANNP
jgi:hypothetical protein